MTEDFKIKKYLKRNIFCFTYGDGVGNIDIKQKIKFHLQSGISNLGN